MVTPKEKLIQLKRSEWRRKRDDARAVHRRIGGISYALSIKVTRREQNVESHKISDFYHDLDGAFGGRRIHHLGNPMEAFNRGARHLERSLPCVLGRLPDNPEMIALSASLIGRLGSSVFRLSTAAVSMSLAGSCFSSESAPRPFQYGIRERGGTIYWAALPLNERQVQADKRTHLIHRPARDIFPPLGGARVFSYRIWSFTALMLPLLLGSSGTRCRQPICGA